MKQKDIILIVVIVVISAVFSLILSNHIFGSPAARQQEVTVAQPISTDFPKPDSQFFNSSSLDPTQLITISQSNNTTPFNSSTSQ
jgi:hypothetical protein